MRRVMTLGTVAVLVLCSITACKKRSPTTPDDKEPSPSFTESNQVAWSGAPITTAGCSTAVHTWTWTITIRENNGAGGLTVDYLDAVLDGVTQPRQTINGALQANGTVIVPRAVCHGDGVQHTVQETLVTSYKGRASTFTNTITLLARPR